MRDLKFIGITGNKRSEPFQIGSVLSFEAYDEIIQYTGLKDKNGKEIYEGDRVKYLEWFDGYGKNSIEEEWIAELECTKFKRDSSGGPDGEIWYTDIEIIGNIREETI